ncbi:hypothetical protein BC940DRAFT_298185 [Gongronella butleri]|nr:hypothetical protein BC940DRAFT_298185 [Gongronella butleri]
MAKQRRATKDGTPTSTKGEFETDFISFDDDPMDIMNPPTQTAHGPERVFYPWWNSDNDHDVSRLAIIKSANKECSDFVKYLQPLPHEIEMRNRVVQKITSSIQKQYPGASVHAFGSFATGLYLPNGDIDLVVQCKSISSYNLHDLANWLKKDGITNGPPQVISRATVPVIKFTDKLTRIKVDIIVNSMSGVSAASYLNKELKRHPGMAELTLIVKHLLALRNLNEVYTGGMGGYGLSCMVLSFLQMHPKVSNNSIDPCTNLAVLLMDFFKLYGYSMAVGRVSLDVANKRYKPCFARDRQGRSVYSIIDPLDRSNDLGTKSYSAGVIQGVFRKAYNSMNGVMHDLLAHRIAKPAYFDVKATILNHVGVIPTSMSDHRSHLLQVHAQHH